MTRSNFLLWTVGTITLTIVLGSGAAMAAENPANAANTATITSTVSAASYPNSLGGHETDSSTSNINIGTNTTNTNDSTQTGTSTTTSQTQTDVSAASAVTASTNITATTSSTTSSPTDTVSNTANSSNDALSSSTTTTVNTSTASSPSSSSTTATDASTNSTNSSSGSTTATNTSTSSTTVTTTPPIGSIASKPVSVAATASSQQSVKSAKTVYVVKAKDTLYLIAKKFNTTVESIKAQNGLKSEALFIGQKLKVPTAPTKVVTKIINYTVKTGDTLFLLAKKFVSSVASIKATNYLKSDWLFVDQFLKIPTAASDTLRTSQYTVKKGDTLFLLAKSFGTTASGIKSLNKLTSNALWIGQVLYIPISSGSGTVTPFTAQGLVSSVSRYQATQSELLLLARLIYSESRGESYQGQVAVGAVVLNRVVSSLFPNTIGEVIYQNNGYEFSAVLDGQINLNPDETAMKAAQDALKGIDPSIGALYYWNPVKAPNNQFLNSRTVTTQIGNHIFAK